MSAGVTGNAPKAPIAVERFVKQLNIAYRAAKLYPASSEIPAENAAAAVGALELALRQDPAMRLVVTKDGLLYEGKGVFPHSAGFLAFSRELYSRNLSEVRFHSGCGTADVMAFLSLLRTDPETLAASGGLEAALWDKGVASITVGEVLTRIVDQEPLEEESGTKSTDEEGWPPSPERIAEVLAGATASRPNDARLLVRFMQDPATLRAFLNAPPAGYSAKPSVSEVSSRIGSIARCVRFELPDEREALLRSLAEAILDLDPEVRRQVLSERLLGEARRDESLAAVIRQMSLEEVMGAILDFVPDTPEARSGLARALRNLAFISISGSREAVLAAAGDALHAQGADDATVSRILETAAPKRLEVTDGTRSSKSDPVESVLRLLEFAPRESAIHAYDADIASLRTESGRGLTDGDVLASLVTIAILETRHDVFTSITALLEDSVGLLVDQQEFEVAADAAEALKAAGNDPAIGAAHRRRLGEILVILAKPRSMSAIASAMRVYRHDSREHRACRRLLAVLGTQTIAPLLEVLAEEPDMAARKSLVDLVSSMASGYVQELGRAVSDPRWFFVRNVVAILGATQDRATLPYLERTLRHPDARVRRETIRALSRIRDALSEEMLTSSLEDPDRNNVRLAVRFLGALKSRRAAAALERVARGEGSTRKAGGLRIEAIEALGRIGAPSSLQVLQDLAGQRSLLAGRGSREIRAAAGAALGALTAQAKGGAEAQTKGGAEAQAKGGAQS